MAKETSAARAPRALPATRASPLLSREKHRQRDGLSIRNIAREMIWRIRIAQPNFRSGPNHGMKAAQLFAIAAAFLAGSATAARPGHAFQDKTFENHNIRSENEQDTPSGVAAYRARVATANRVQTPAATSTPTPSPTPSEPKTLNISTRLRVETGDNVLIGGFIITGTAQKSIAVRGLGPSLAQVGISDALADPTLELHVSNGG